MSPMNLLTAQGTNQVASGNDNQSQMRGQALRSGTRKLFVTCLRHCGPCFTMPGTDGAVSTFTSFLPGIVTLTLSSYAPPAGVDGREK